MLQRSVANEVGALVMVGFEGTSADKATIDFVKGAAGAILFARNVETAAQTAELVRSLQAAASDAGSPALIIAVDQEGGSVSRLGGVGTATPSAMALGAAADVAVTEEIYRVIGDELAALGVTLDFAPVADVNNNPANPVIGTRSFGEDPAAVGRHVAAAIAALHAAGIAATAKHFPGHGDTAVDSHQALPVADHDLARLRAVELPPFRAAVAGGVDAIMTAHLALPRIDSSGVPATLSRAVIEGIAREELAFDRVICTDCMEMKAVSDRYAPGDAAVRAIEAGADLLLFSSSLDAARQAVAALRAAVLEGRIAAAQIERSLARLERLRARPAERRPAQLETIGSESHRAAALSAARKAVTIVRDPLSRLPLALPKGQKIFVVEFGDRPSRLAKFLARGPARIHEQLRGLEPAGHEYKQLLMAAGSADALVAVTRRASMHKLQAQALADLTLVGKPLIVVAAREPYDALAAPPDAAVLATYGDDDASMDAAAEVILGMRTAQGRLPVAASRVAASAVDALP